MVKSSRCFKINARKWNVELSVTFVPLLLLVREKSFHKHSLSALFSLPLVRFLLPLLLTFPHRRRGVNVRNRFASPHFSEFIFALHGAFTFVLKGKKVAKPARPDCMMNKRKVFGYELTITWDEVSTQRESKRSAFESFVFVCAVMSFMRAKARHKGNFTHKSSSICSWSFIQFFSFAISSYNQPLT